MASSGFCAWRAIAAQTVKFNKIGMKGERGKTYLREWRKHKGLSLEQASAAVGISHANLGRIERGLVPYNQDLIENLALLYGVDPAELLRIDPERVEERDQVLNFWDHASVAERRQIYRVVEAIAGGHDEEERAGSGER